MLTRVVSVPGPKSSIMFDVWVIVLRGAMAVWQVLAPSKSCLFSPSLTTMPTKLALGAQPELEPTLLPCLPENPAHHPQLAWVPLLLV